MTYTYRAVCFAPGSQFYKYYTMSITYILLCPTLEYKYVLYLVANMPET